jgi:hypothetical protein
MRPMRDRQFTEHRNPEWRDLVLQGIDTRPFPGVSSGER